MPRAYSLIRPAPWYRAQAFTAGLARAGYELSRGEPKGRPGDVLLMWNRYWGSHEQATRFEAEGGTVVVAENGYLGAGGSSPKFDVHPHGPRPEHYYALALGFHNDDSAERFPSGGPERWARLGVPLKPWRTDGDYILVAPNRPFGVAGRAMHKDWARSVVIDLERKTRIPIKVREHPGNDAPKRSISEDLARARAVVIWSSSAGVHALAAGVPVFCHAPAWILKGAAAGGSVEGPILPDRLPHFERMAWGQWRIEEIETGEPFRWLLEGRT